MARRALRLIANAKLSKYSCLILCLIAVLVTMSNSALAQCGEANQRACCLGEGSNQGSSPSACFQGQSLITTAQCPPIAGTDPAFQGSCACGTDPAFNAINSCVPATPCGGKGQRACCVGEGSGACNSGLTQVSVCDPNEVEGGNCYCASGPFANGTTTSSTSCVVATACGGEGERACCVGEGSGACNNGLVQVSGCDNSTGSCACTNILALSSGTCVQPTDCGKAGERACCIGTLEYSNNNSQCDSQLTLVDGCVGDCTCGGATATGQVATQSCAVFQAVAEPSTNSETLAPNETTTPWTLPPVTLPGPSDPECPPTGLCGIADVHVHMFANLGHGGAGLAGEAWDPQGINTALGEDYGSSLSLEIGPGLKPTGGNPEPKVDGTAGLPKCPGYLLNSAEGNLCNNQVKFHGDHTAYDSVVGGGSNDGAGSNLGVPNFSGWPLWSSTIHQQVYWKWLERAWQGGMRLMVMHAVSNETFCKGNPVVSGADCTLPMTFIDSQLNAANQFQQWLDQQYGGASGQGWTNSECQMADPNCYATSYGAPGPGWYQIVTSPQQATAVIQQGKLAVVLGIEVDNLFNCHFVNFQGSSGPPLNGEGPTCSPAYVQQQLQTYYDRGVRHIFPIHDFDNAFGGTATWEDALNIGNFVEEGTYWDATNCTNPGYGFDLNPALETIENILGFGIDTIPSYPSFTTGSCNATGLTSLGMSLVQQAMQLGMIIDVDHMSINSFNNTISLAQSAKSGAGYAGISAGHVLFFDLYQQQYSGTTDVGGQYGRHERMRTSSQVQSIASLGGMLGLITKDDTQDTGNGWCRPEGSCPFGAGSGLGGEYTVNYNNMNNNCRYSTTEWVQSYLYGVNAVGGPVALGSDFNGVAGHLGPRFGSDACGGNGVERSAQEKTKNRLVYPFTVAGFGTFDKQVTGERTFDYNVDGLAHIGLIPDMIQDLKNVGVTDTQLQPLFGSAQAYINMWSKVYVPPPAATHFSVVGPSTAADGQLINLSVTALDQNNNQVPFYSGTVNTTGTYYPALPGPLAVTSPTFSIPVRPFSGSTGDVDVTFTVTDVNNSNLTGTSNQILDYQGNGSPFITSPSSATFTVGQNATFSFSGNGAPAPTFNFTGNIPNNLNVNVTINPFSITGFYGVPAVGTGGVYNLTVTASNGIPPNGTQHFQLIVDEAPGFSIPNTPFYEAQQGTVPFSYVGYPIPYFYVSAGSLPSGVTIYGQELTGTPAQSVAGGVYPVQITGTNGVGSPATQSYNLVVYTAPIFQGPFTFNFVVGTFGSYQEGTSGYPAPTYTSLSNFPSGIKLGSGGLVSGTPVAGTVGQYVIGVQANNAWGGEDTLWTVNIGKTPTVTNISVPASVVVGTAATIKAVISSPVVTTGTVTFSDSSTVIGTAKVVNGVATLITKNLPDGANSLSAVYSGDSNNLGSTGTASLEILTPTTTTLQSSVDPSAPGQLVTFTANVATPSLNNGSGTPPNGESVTFKTGSALLGTGTLTNGSATFSTSSLKAGTTKIVAYYGGDLTLGKSSSEILSQAVNTAETTNTALVGSPDPSVYGQSVTLTATVNAPSGTPPNGDEVIFQNGSVVLGSGTLTGGQASISTSSLPVGTVKITALYQGDAAFSKSSSIASQVVGKARTITTLAVSPTLPTVFNITVAPQFVGTPTGTVTIYNGSTKLKTVTLGSGGTVSVDITNLGTGPDYLVANYNGNSDFTGSSSNTLCVGQGCP